MTIKVKAVEKKLKFTSEVEAPENENGGQNQGGTTSGDGSQDDGGGQN